MDMRWVLGRQENTEYFKFKIYAFRIFRFAFDCYILKYPKGTYLKPHKDPVKTGRHYRMNILLKGDADFICNWYQSAFNGRIILFRPDLAMHALRAFKKTYKISFGYVNFKP